MSQTEIKNLLATLTSALIILKPVQCPVIELNQVLNNSTADIEWVVETLQNWLDNYQLNNT